MKSILPKSNCIDDVFLFIIVILLSSPLHIFAQKNYAVEVGAFDKKVALSYFYKLPEADVYEVLDVNDIYRYWIDCQDKNSAENLRQDVMTKGFVNARIIDFKALEEHCKASCGYTPPVATSRTRNNRNGNQKDTKETSPLKFRDQNYVIPTQEDFAKEDKKGQDIDLGKPTFFDTKNEKIECLFYDYKSPDLRQKSKDELDKLASVLLQNKNYSVKIYAHTDANGSDSYNYKLSETRAKIAQKYLNFRGVKDAQINNGPFGERRPIAMNALTDGADTPEGRQLNRRIELVIYDGNGKELDLVKPIIVPSNLKIKK